MSHELGCFMGLTKFHCQPTLERKYEPAIKMLASILDAALKTPNVQRVFITSSIVTSRGIIPQRFVSTTTHAVLPPMLNVYKNVLEANLLHKADYAQMFSYPKAAYPKAVKEQIFKRGNLPIFPMIYDSDAAKKVLRREFKSLKSAVVGVDGQCLEKLGKEKA